MRVDTENYDGKLCIPTCKKKRAQSICAKMCKNAQAKIPKLRKNVQKCANNVQIMCKRISAHFCAIWEFWLAHFCASNMCKNVLPKMCKNVHNMCKHVQKCAAHVPTSWGTCCAQFICGGFVSSRSSQGSIKSQTGVAVSCRWSSSKIFSRAEAIQSAARAPPALSCAKMTKMRSRPMPTNISR